MVSLKLVLGKIFYSKLITHSLLEQSYVQIMTFVNVYKQKLVSVHVRKVVKIITYKERKQAVKQKNLHICRLNRNGFTIDVYIYTFNLRIPTSCTLLQKSIFFFPTSDNISLIPKQSHPNLLRVTNSRRREVAKEKVLSARALKLWVVATFISLLFIIT